MGFDFVAVIGGHVNVFIGVVLHHQFQINQGRFKTRAAEIHLNGQGEGAAFLRGAIDFTGVSVEFQALRQFTLHNGEGGAVPGVHVVGGNHAGIGHVLDALRQFCVDNVRCRSNTGQFDFPDNFSADRETQRAADFTGAVRQQTDLGNIGKGSVSAGIRFASIRFIPIVGTGERRKHHIFVDVPVFIQFDVDCIFQCHADARHVLLAKVCNQDIMNVIIFSIQIDIPLIGTGHQQFFIGRCGGFRRLFGCKGNLIVFDIFARYLHLQHHRVRHGIRPHRVFQTGLTADNIRQLSAGNNHTIRNPEDRNNGLDVIRCHFTIYEYHLISVHVIVAIVTVIGIQVDAAGQVYHIVRLPTTTDVYIPDFKVRLHRFFRHVRLVRLVRLVRFHIGFINPETGAICGAIIQNHCQCDRIVKRRHKTGHQLGLDVLCLGINSRLLISVVSEIDCLGPGGILQLDGVIIL